MLDLVIMSFKSVSNGGATPLFRTEGHVEAVGHVGPVYFPGF